MRKSKVPNKRRTYSKWGAASKDITTFMEEQGMLIPREKLSIKHPVIDKNIKNKK